MTGLPFGTVRIMQSLRPWNIASNAALSREAAMNPLDQVVDDYMQHSKGDYVGLWAVVSTIRHELGIHDDDEV
ncbi:MAG: hypothetical protein HY246_00110, partial [Proteobacteria bacterium]|nr:hypothetical protein [Pseudomonadota bacterium]